MSICRTLAALSLLTAVAACGSDSDASEGRDAATERSPEAATSSASDPSDDEGAAVPEGPAFPDGTASQTARPKGEWDLVLTDVRVGHHEGFDRVVLEFDGTGTPGWAVGYVDRARADGSGETIALDGDAVLDVYARGTTYPGTGAVDSGYDGPQHFRPEDASSVAEVHVVGTFEGDTQVVVGIDGDRVPFRTFALTGPARLVVDVLDTED